MLFFEFSNKKIILFMCLLPSHFDIAHYYLLKVNQEEGFIDHGFYFMHKSLEQNKKTVLIFIETRQRGSEGEAGWRRWESD